LSKPKLLDLFSCAGGAAVGYHRAGFDVYGVEMDKNRAKHYPFPVHVGDALGAMRTLNSGGKVDFTHPDGTVEWLGLGDFVAVHASPPCQGYTRGNAGKETSWPKLIPAVRALLLESGLPYAIENVKDAAPEMRNPTYLCGCMFDLSTIDDDGVRIHLQRGRMFETSFPLEAPRPCDHSDHEWVAGAYGGARRDKHEAKYVRKGGYVPPNKAVVAALLGIEHPMTWMELFESIPPAYAEHVGMAIVALGSVDS
jgi:DNA (cytosine-5)-methyltransferase 1